MMDTNEHDQTAEARCFGLGCDARLSGVPRTFCPFSGSHRAAWIQGWDDVARHYASRVHGRWRYRPLPAVPSGLRSEEVA